MAPDGEIVDPTADRLARMRRRQDEAYQRFLEREARVEARVAEVWRQIADDILRVEKKLVTLP